MHNELKDKLEDIYEQLFQLSQYLNCDNTESCEECKHYEYCSLISEAFFDISLAINRLL